MIKDSEYELPNFKDNIKEKWTFDKDSDSAQLEVSINIELKREGKNLSKDWGAYADHDIIDAIGTLWHRIGLDPSTTVSENDGCCFTLITNAPPADMTDFTGTLFLNGIKINNDNYEELLNKMKELKNDETN